MSIKSVISGLPGVARARCSLSLSTSAASGAGCRRSTTFPTLSVLPVQQSRQQRPKCCQQKQQLQLRQQQRQFCQTTIHYKERGSTEKGVNDLSTSEKPKIWDYQQVLGSVLRLQDTELHGHIIHGELMSIVDVREVNEYKDGHIPRAINVPLSVLAQVDSQVRPDASADLFKAELLNYIDDLPIPDSTGLGLSESIKTRLFGDINPDASKFVDKVDAVVYCKAGVRSAHAAEILTRRLKSGKPNVVIGDYTGSWDDWIARGGEVERP